MVFYPYKVKNPWRLSHNLSKLITSTTGTFVTNFVKIWVNWWKYNFLVTYLFHFFWDQRSEQTRRRDCTDCFSVLSIGIHTYIHTYSIVERYRIRASLTRPIRSLARVQRSLAERVNVNDFNDGASEQEASTACCPHPHVISQARTINSDDSKRTNKCHTDWVSALEPR